MQRYVALGGTLDPPLLRQLPAGPIRRTAATGWAPTSPVRQPIGVGTDHGGRDSCDRCTSSGMGPFVLALLALVVHALILARLSGIGGYRSGRGSGAVHLNHPSRRMAPGSRPGAGGRRGREPPRTTRAPPRSPQRGALRSAFGARTVRWPVARWDWSWPLRFGPGHLPPGAGGLERGRPRLRCLERLACLLLGL